ncbi:MAG: aromatic amino acid transport family protein [Waddliaceae bacterium]
MNVKHKVFGGVLLVAGTTIGAGMLALPIVTGLAGFVPTVFLFIVYWFYMTYTALLLLEVNLCLGEEINLISMAKKTLGKSGEIAAWITYLFLLYLLVTAYLAEGGPIVADFFNLLFGTAIPAWVGAIPLLLGFGFIVYEGTQVVDIVNRWLMVGLVVGYGAIVMLLIPHIDENYLARIEWKPVLLAIPLVATSFGYHVIIPTLTTYLHQNVRYLVKVVVIGSLIPLTVYIIWEIVTLGVIPIEGSHGIVQGYQEGASGVRILARTLGSPFIIAIAQFFSFCAIVTSFLGVTLSLSDFLTDGLNIKKTMKGRFILFALTFLPPLLFILTNPRAFVSALEFAGAFGVVILLGLLPPMMAWSRRYRKHMPSPFTVPGGKIGLSAAIVLSLLVIAVEISIKMYSFKG